MNRRHHNLTRDKTKTLKARERRCSMCGRGPKAFRERILSVNDGGGRCLLCPCGVIIRRFGRPAKPCCASPSVERELGRAEKPWPLQP